MPNIPLNQIVAFLKPYLNIVASAVATWLLVHVHVLGLFHITQSSLANWIVAGVLFIVTFVAQEVKDHHWLKGWQAFEAREAQNKWLYPEVYEQGSQVDYGPEDPNATVDPPIRPEPGPDQPSPMK